MRTALLLGGSGLVGRFCLQALQADSSYTKIILLLRKELPGAEHSKVEQKVMPLESLDSAAFPPLHDVFCALGTTIRKAGSQEAFRRVDLEMPVTAARQARKAGAQRFILVSSVGADAKSTNFYLRTKGKVEQELRSMQFAALHIFRPSFLLGRRAEYRLGEALGIPIARLFRPLMAGTLRKYRPIEANTVGTAMVAAAKIATTGVFIHEYDEIQRLAASFGEVA